MVYNYLEKQTIELEEKLQAMLNQYEELQFMIKEKSTFVRVLEEGIDRQVDTFSPYDLNHDSYEKLGAVKEELGRYRDEASFLKLEIQNTENKISDFKGICDEVKKMEEDKISCSNQNENKSKDSSLYHFEAFGLDEFDYAGFRLRILETQELERKRIARDLHDSPVQNLTAMVHKVDLCTRIIDSDPIRCKIELLNITKNMKNTINEMRRIIYDLRPMALDDIGLETALARELKRIERQCNIQIDFSYDGYLDHIESTVSSTLFRIVQEACYNAVKHGECILIKVKLNVTDNMVTVIIEDNGISYINISASKIEDRKEMYQKLGFSLSYYDVNKLNVLYDGKKNKKDYRCYGIMTKKDFFDKINNKEDNTEKHDRVINSNSGYVYNLFLLFGSIMFLCYLCVQGAIYLVK